MRSSRNLRLFGVILVTLALSIAGNLHASKPDPDVPLQPRYDTPSKRKTKKKRPVFKKPSQLPKKKAPEAQPVAAAAAAPADVSVPDDGIRYRIPYHAPEMYSFTDGWTRSWNGEQFLVRPRDVPAFPETMTKAAAKGGKGVFYARGFYSYLSHGFREWSGTELLGYIDIADGFTGSMMFHHELRETRAEMLRASLSARLWPNYHLITTLGAGNGADYVPVTSLDVELRAPFPKRSYLHYGVGLGTSSWTHERRQVKVSAAAIAHVAKSVSAELRLTGFALDTKVDPARFYLRTTWTLRTGTHGKRIFQLRFALGESPEYGPGVADLANLSDELTIDASWGFRNWVKRHYGYVINVNLGGQLHTFARSGLDASVFLEF